MMALFSMLDERASGPELMDSPDFGQREIDQTFRLLVPVNRLFGGIAPSLSFFRYESRGWDKARTYHILDAGCGVGDLAVALARWGRRAGYRLRIDGVDHHPYIIELGRKRAEAYPEIQLSCGDVLQLEEGTYDYVHASQFVHHFADDEIVSLLKHLLRLCRCKVVVNDLERTTLAYLATWLFTLFSTPVFRHDARLSVRRGFRVNELRLLLQDGGLSDFAIKRRFFYRIVLVLSKAEECTNLTDEMPDPC
jgi:2-polyprenyl-3-methyl-5-hydroxy-6-metoxy-1,4-benzoquinol methylase